MANSAKKKFSVLKQNNSDMLIVIYNSSKVLLKNALESFKSYEEDRIEGSTFIREIIHPCYRLETTSF